MSVTRPTNAAGEYATRVSAYIHTTFTGDDGVVATVYGKVGSAVEAKAVTLNSGTPVHVTGTGSAEFTDIYAISLSAALQGALTVKDAASADWNIDMASGDTGFGAQMFTGDGIELDENAVITVYSEAGVDDELLVFSKDAAGADQAELLTLNATTNVVGTAVNSKIVGFGTAAVANGKKVYAKGRLLNSGSTITLASTSTADTTQVVTLYGLDSNGAVQSEAVTLTGQVGAVSTGTWKSLHGMSM